MRVLPIIIVGLVFASAAFLVQPVQAQPVSSVTGSVCAASAWDPAVCEQTLAGAAVRLTGGPAGAGLVDETKTTGDGGRFTFDNVAQGSYTLHVSRAGFKAATINLSAPAADQKAILQAESVTVEGTIKDSSGATVAGARISFWGPEWASARSDAGGKYTVQLRAGAYTMEVDAAKQGYIQQQVFVDGSRLDVTLGVLAGQDAKLQGRVVDQDGQPVVGADVIIDQWEKIVGGERQYGNYRNWTTTDAQGRYSANVYAGSLSVRFSKAGHSESYEWAEIGSGKSRTIDAELAKYPEKTARLVGKVVDAAGKPLAPVTISIQHPEYGLYSCSIDNRYASGAPESMPKPMQADGGSAEMSYYEDPYYYDPGCDITVHADGTFTGNVTPGYAILSVWYDHYASCKETRTSNGHYTRDCGPDYYGFTQSLVLQPDADNAIAASLRQRPGPDATISGYLVNGETQTAVANGHISFNNQETYAWGQAQTDKDGSYKLRVRSGYHHVNVYAEGFLPWQGVVFIGKGADMPFDVVLTPGEARYGGCCYAYATDDMAHAEAAPASSSQGSSGASSPGKAMPMEADVGSGEGSDFEDLGGGLGPYDAAKRMQAQTAAGKQSPVPVALVLVALGLVALRRRS